MKKRGCIALLAAMICAVSFAAFAAEAPRAFDAKAYGMEGEYLVLQEAEGNLQRDKSSEIRLIAERDKDSVFDKALWLEVRPKGGKAFLVPLKEIAGFDAEIELKNFTSPWRSDIFLSMQTGGSGGLGNYYVIEITDEGKPVFHFNSESTQLPAVKGEFLDDYRGDVVVRETDKETQAFVNLTSRKEQYDKGGVYDPKSKKLKAPVEIWGGGYSQLIPMDADNDGIDELRGVLELSGVDHTDRIASIVYTLKYRDGKWDVVNSRIVPAEGLLLMPTPRAGK